MFRKTIFGIATTLLLAPFSHSEAAKITLKVEHDEPTSSITHRVLEDMAKEVAKASGGEVELGIYPSCSLSGGSIKTMIANTQLGSTDIAYIATSIYAPSLDPTLGVFHLPFMFKDINAMEKVARKSDLAKRLFAKQEAKNLHVIDSWSRNLRQFVNKKKSVSAPADMKGITFRVPGNELWVDAVKALGANVVSMPFAEVPVALQTGAVDGAERPTEFLVSEEWWTMAKYVTLANYTGDVLMIGANKATWESLPKNIQDLLIKAIVKYGDRKLEEEIAFQNKAAETLRGKGMDVTILDDEQSRMFREKMKPVWEKHAKNIGPDIVAEAEKLVSQ